MAKTAKRYDANRDPITGARGAHPVGTGVGAVAGAALAGATTGMVAGPLGTAIGAAAGAIAGAFAGKAVAEHIDPTAEVAYWRDHYATQPYADAGLPFDEFEPAYRYGAESYARHGGERYEDLEPRLAAGWEEARLGSSLSWERARHATRDAWKRVSDRVERTGPADPGRRSD